MKHFNRFFALMLAVLMTVSSFALWISAEPDAGLQKLTVDPDSIDGTPGNGTSEGLAQALDGNKNTKYLTATVPAEIVFSLEEAAVVNYYELTSADHAEWDPKAWTLYGMNDDDDDWTALDSREDQNFTLTPDTNGYSFENTTAYHWYKLEITESHGEAFGFCIAVSELELFYGTPAEEEIEGVVVDLDSVTGTPGNGSSEGLVQAFDGNPGTKYLTATLPAEIIFKLKKAAAVRLYELTSTDHGEWDPKAWTFYGSADGSAWTAIDSQSDQNFTGRGVTNAYVAANDTAYLWYKLVITETHGEAFGFKAAIAELTMSDEMPAEEAISILPDSISGTPGNGTSEGLAQAFDGNPNSKYLTATLPAEIIFSLNKSAVVNYYEMTVTDHSEWDPKAWTFYGSADGSAWTAIDSRTNQDFDGRYETNTYFFENKTEYLWYKLEITGTHGEAFGFKAAIAEFEVDFVTVDLETVDGTAGHGDHTIYSLFDGDTDSKYLVFRSSDDETVEVFFQMTRPVVVNTYKLITADDQDIRDPKDWKVYGSDDGETWELLDERADEVMTRRVTEYPFQFDNDAAYDWFKFEFTANNGLDPWGNNIIQLSGITLFNTEDELVDDSITVDAETITSSEGFGGNNAIKLFDGDAGSKFLTQGTTGYVQFALKSPKAINSYTMTSATDWAARHPSAWVLYGSNDGESWVKLDERTGESPKGFAEEHKFVFTNDVEYLWFKLEMTARNCSKSDAVSPPLIGFAELALEVVDEPALLTHQLTIDPDSVVAPDGTTNNGVANLIDNDGDTRYLVASGSIDVIFQLTKPAPVNRYSITGSKDHLERSPKTFAFYGSFDGVKWVELDRRDLEAKSSSDKRTYCGEAFEFENSTVYPFYKLSVEAVSAGSYTAMSKLNVFCAYPEEGLDVYVPACVTDLTGVVEATPLKSVTVKALSITDESVEALESVGPLTVYGHAKADGSGLVEFFEDSENVTFVNLLEVVSNEDLPTEGLQSDKRTLTAVGALKVADLEYKSLSFVFTFKQNGETVKTLTNKHPITSVYKTITGVASVSESTASASGLCLIDAAYLTAATVRGIPEEAYDVEIQLFGYVVVGEEIVEVCSNVAEFHLG